MQDKVDEKRGTLGNEEKSLQQRARERDPRLRRKGGAGTEVKGRNVQPGGEDKGLFHFFIHYIIFLIVLLHH